MRVAKPPSEPKQTPIVHATGDLVADAMCRTAEIGLMITGAADAGTVTIIDAAPVTVVDSCPDSCKTESTRSESRRAEYPLRVRLLWFSIKDWQGRTLPNLGITRRATGGVPGPLY